MEAGVKGFEFGKALGEGKLDEELAKFWEKSGESLMTGFEQDDLLKSLQDTWKNRIKDFPDPLKDFKKTTEDLPKIITDVKKFANTARDELAGLLDQEEEDRLYEGVVAMWMDLAKPAAKAGRGAGTAFSNEFAKALRFDAVAAFSAEAFVSDWEQQMFKSVGGGGGGKGGGMGALGIEAQNVQPMLGRLNIGMDEQVSTAKHMDGLLAKIERHTAREPVTLMGAGLG
jgi:hypothetical protein